MLWVRVSRDWHEAGHNVTKVSFRWSCFKPKGCRIKTYLQLSQVTLSVTTFLFSNLFHEVALLPSPYRVLARYFLTHFLPNCPIVCHSSSPSALTMLWKSHGLPQANRATSPTVLFLWSLLLAPRHLCLLHPSVSPSISKVDPLSRGAHLWGVPRACLSLQTFPIDLGCVVVYLWLSTLFINSRPCSPELPLSSQPAFGTLVTTN